MTGGDRAREENIADEGERVGGGRQIGEGGREGGVGAAARGGPSRRGEQVRIPRQIQHGICSVFIKNDAMTGFRNALFRYPVRLLT